MHTPPMSTPAPPPVDPPPPTGMPISTDPPAPAVPYGGAVEPVDAAAVRAPMTAQNVAKGVGKAALWVGIRAVLFFAVKALLKGLAKR
jgi:hypothetical protein